jgi:hypothetical protein
LLISLSPFSGAQNRVCINIFESRTSISGVFGIQKGFVFAGKTDYNKVK